MSWGQPIKPLGSPGTSLAHTAMAAAERLARAVSLWEQMPTSNNAEAMVRARKELDEHLRRVQ